MTVATPRARALPSEVRDLALRMGATDDPALTAVTLKQKGTMRTSPTGRTMRFSATQTIEVSTTGFVWCAKSGPLGSITVTDALQGGVGRLAVHLLGAIKIAGVAPGSALSKGEIMRYIAELAWAPDAILANETLSWDVSDSRTMVASAGQGAARGSVELTLDDEGRIVGVSAKDRPFADGKKMMERPWQGHFSDYRQHRGRWLPFAGEVGWIIDGVYTPYWHGRLVDWSIA